MYWLNSYTKFSVCEDFILGGGSRKKRKTNPAIYLSGVHSSNWCQPAKGQPFCFMVCIYLDFEFGSTPRQDDGYNFLSSVIPFYKNMRGEKNVLIPKVIFTQTKNKSRFNFNTSIHLYTHVYVYIYIAQP